MRDGRVFAGGKGGGPAVPDASALVQAFLGAMQARQLEDARRMLAPNFAMHFPGAAPMHRLEELLALSRAGIVRFVGADMWVEAVDGAFLAGSPTTPDVVRANGLIEARLPTHSLSRTADPVLRSLRAVGDVSEDGAGLVRVSAEGRLINERGEEDPARFAVGPYTTGKAFAAFARPNTNAPAFRQNDVLARAILRQLGN